MTHKVYYPGLDLLRLFAAFWVMNFHYFFGLTDKLSWYRYGNFGVPLFFIISGFVISQSVAHKSVKGFAIGRFIRLYPLFWVACSLTYVFTLLMPNGVPVRFPEYLISMTMLGDKFSSALGYGSVVDPVYWTLAVELIFYVAIGLFVYLFSWKYIRAFFWGWIALSMLSFSLHIDQMFIMKMLLVRHASYFILGGVLALYFGDEVRTLHQKISDFLLLITTLTYSTFISFIALPPYFVPNKLDGTIIAIAHPLLFGLVVLFIYLSKFLTNKKARIICGVIGGLTYPIYLLHQVIGNTLIDYFKAYGDATTRGVVVMIVMIIVSYFVYLYDKKLRKFLSLKLLPRK